MKPSRAFGLNRLQAVRHSGRVGETRLSRGMLQQGISQSKGSEMQSRSTLKSLSLSWASFRRTSYTHSDEPGLQRPSRNVVCCTLALHAIRTTPTFAEHGTRGRL